MSVGIVDKQTGERIPTAGMPAIDSVLSGTSTNPVQNRVVKAALDDKADTDIVASDFDATASYTAGNYCIYEGKFYRFKTTHSGAWVAADVDEIKIAGELSALKSGLTNYEATTNATLALPTNTGKNVFPITIALLKDRNTDGTWSGNDYTISGVTFACTFNSDGYLTSITANGTSTAYIYFRFYQRTINPLHLDGSFIVSGGLNDNAIFVVGRTYNGAWQVLGASKGGDSNPFTVALSDDIGANIEADNGTEFTNATFYPMIRPATITDPTFAPYIPSVESRIEKLEKGDVYKINAGGSVEISIDWGVYMYTTGRDAARFLTVGYIGYTWDGTPVVKTMISETNTFITATAGTGNKVTFANSSTNSSATLVVHKII